MPASPTTRLLIVDDENALMTALRDTLRDEGYRATGVTSAADGLAALRKGGYDLVLTDLVMPKMDGIAFLNEALALDPFLVAIMMTGHGSIPTAVAAMQNGATDYVLKPIRFDALLPAIERALTLRRLRVRNAELEQRVRERTAELEAANKDLEAFSYSVSHDLRTPLRTISGFAEIVLEHHGDGLSPEVRRQVGLIQRGAEEMSELINALLGFARFGRHALVPQKLDLGALAREAFAELSAGLEGRRVELRVQELPPAWGDLTLLRQVVFNLVSNALKYSRPRDPAVVEVGMQAGPKPAYYVRDNGVGFDARYAEKLFQVFQRLHHAHEFEGTGVGLASVRRILERHGGEIWAESRPGQGATFFFTLPAGAPRAGSD